jgi:hypothetical protein
MRLPDLERERTKCPERVAELKGRLKTYRRMTIVAIGAIDRRLAQGLTSLK